MTKIYRATAQNGSPPPQFDFDEGRSYFRTTLLMHPGSLAINALRDAAQLQALGDQQSAQEILKAARGTLEETIGLEPAEPRTAWAWFFLGQVLRTLRAPEHEVRHAFEQAHGLLPDEERFRREIESR